MAGGPSPSVESTAGETPMVVGVGASAGGISALKKLFERVPAGSGCAWVVILHLSPDHESRLAEIIQGSTALPVAQVVDCAELTPDRIYVIPRTRASRRPTAGWCSPISSMRRNGDRPLTCSFGRSRTVTADGRRP